MKSRILLFYFILFLSSYLNAQSTSESQIIFDKYLSNGFKYHDNRKLDSCLYFLKKVDSLVKLSPKDSTKFYKKEVLEATLFVRKGKTGDAIGKHLKAYEFFKKQKDSSNIGITLYNLGVASYYSNRRSVAGEYFNEALIYKEFISKRLLTRIHQNYGTIHLENGLLSKPKDTFLIYKSIRSYREAIAIYKEEKWLMEEILSTSLLSESYNQLGDYDTALKIINDAISLAKKATNKSQEGFALIKKTTFLGNKKRYHEALKTIQIASPIFKELGDKPTYLYSLLEEKKILKGLGKYKEATMVGDSIFQVSTRVYDIRIADKISEMETKYKTAEKEKEILKQKEVLLAQELSIKNRNLFGILISSLLIILLIISFFEYKKNKFKRDQLQKEIDLKDALATIKTQNKLQEQKLQISRDLHDNIGSQLTFIISSLDNLKFISKDLSENLKKKLSTISSFTGSTIYELRDTIWAMNKYEVSTEDIETRLLFYIGKAKSATNKIQFILKNNTKNDLKFTSIQGMNIFRIIQEAVHNAIKHADAKTIEIDLDFSNNLFSAIVKDDGIGFDINKVNSGNGLSNIEKRMSEINGKSFIISSDKGTTVKIVL